ncbi:acetoacetate decarboxylase [Streptoalloteichus tenebrarius]|uniref:Acetoacetate decarboxylase n=1 Tax=Streptoalloteichus tenebrarius (strain ATCC 17920 / DSM 40477 / JCM 4838 / CBS 697.72 / NBRC 16177 / NCIMB 11028 / NRRL B-12390 / A12253. 1 / ISP 5477) TaxID=1933 RepID=A0ABT1HNX2_STRSD|nr:acetoacetate decarboxylase [Streptoalloteichus tenebrarius]MCP2257206.1 acetoacetate decarboxylase [Streptoalloteichus tenebrarius]BFE98841.1 acetoacetate decarboxylase [Streptoalloteichus tenebrarius]
MRPEQLLRAPVTPLAAPPYPLRATRFLDREYLNVVYRTDPDALRAVVPAPLEVVEPLVRFEVMRMGDVDGYGPYTEAGQVIPVRFDGEDGEYLHAMHLDNVAAILAGRELSAYPKTSGSPRLFVEDGALVGTLDYGSQRVATATMAYKHRPLDHEEARRQITVPTFAVKAVPDYTGGLRVCDLVRTQITDITVKQAWEGPARLHLVDHVMAPLADLPVLEIVSASHVLTDLTLAPAVPVHDYLA